MPKKFIFSLICLSAALIVSVLFIFQTGSNKNDVLQAINSENLKNMVADASSDFFVYIGKPTCPYCEEYKPNLVKAITDNDKDTFFYFNTDEHRGEEYFDTILDKLEVYSVPTLLYVKQGEVISIHQYDDGYSEEEIRNWIESLNT